MDCKVAGGIVEAEGMSLTFAEDGQDALDQMALAEPDLVLTDLQMPVMDGLALVREVKKQYPSTPVILVTRAGSEEIAVRGRYHDYALLFWPPKAPRVVDVGARPS